MDGTPISIFPRGRGNEAGRSGVSPVSSPPAPGHGKVRMGRERIARVVNPPPGREKDGHATSEPARDAAGDVDAAFRDDVRCVQCGHRIYEPAAAGSAGILPAFPHPCGRGRPRSPVSEVPVGGASSARRGQPSRSCLRPRRERPLRAPGHRGLHFDTKRHT